MPTCSFPNCSKSARFARGCCHEHLPHEPPDIKAKRDQYNVKQSERQKVPTEKRKTVDRKAQIRDHATQDAFYELIEDNEWRGLWSGMKVQLYGAEERSSDNTLVWKARADGKGAWIPYEPNAGRQPSTTQLFVQKPPQAWPEPDNSWPAPENSHPPPFRTGLHGPRQALAAHPPGRGVEL